MRLKVARNAEIKALIPKGISQQVLSRGKKYIFLFRNKKKKEGDKRADRKGEKATARSSEGLFALERNKTKTKEGKKERKSTKVGPCWKIEHGLLIEQKEKVER